jgi:UDP-N-acetylglucosamine--N-acetylmuramyl-(pentapeptide) pyrophosphoryl-undecaprenol N-acetylglucosamine transferase
MLISALPTLVASVNVIHQTGRANFDAVAALSRVALEGVPYSERYHPVDFMNEVSLQRAAGIASVVVSRAGATAITEIGLWQKPAILIPIPESVSHDQRANAYAYAHTGAAVVLEEANLTPHVLASEIQRIIGDTATQARMAGAAVGFADPDAGRVIGEQVLALALAHES